MKPRLRLICLIGVSSLIIGCGAPQQTGVAPLEVIEINESNTSDNALADQDAPVFRPKSHVVKKGETLNAIALEYGLDYRDLALWNNITNPNLIEVGQNLQLNAPAVVPEVSTVKPVQKQVAVSGTNDKEIKTKTPAAKVQNTRVTRTQVGVGNNRNPTQIETRNPQAIKIPYSNAELKRLQKLAGGAEQAVLVINSPSSVSGPPKNTNEKNGIIWSWPVNGKLTEAYSETNKGIDIGGAKGLPIYASADGRVIYAGSGLKGYGQLVIIKHKNEYLTTYAHNDRIFVAEGEAILRNQKIAEMGDSGTDRVGLHFGIRRGSQSFDPKLFLPRNP